MAKKKNENQEQVEKKPEEMSAAELEQYVSTQSKVVELNADGTRAEQPKEKTPDEEKQKTEETKEETVEQKQEEKEKELILGKFKSYDDVVKAYQEAEKKISQQGQEISLSKKEVELLRQMQQQPQQPVSPQQHDQLAGIRPYFPDMSDEQLMANIGLIGLMVNSGLKNFKQEISKEFEPLYEIKFERDVEKQIQKVRAKYPDFSEYENTVKERLSQLPPNLRAKEGSVETILLTTRGEHLPDAIKAAQLKAQQEMRSVEQKKEEAFVEGGGNTSTRTPPINLGKMSAKELEEYYQKQGGKIV